MMMSKNRAMSECGCDMPDKMANETVAMNNEEANKDTLTVNMIDSTTKTKALDATGLSTSMRPQGLQ